MAWSIADVARMSGVTSRTLRHYDEVGLLPPAWVAGNGYRHYEEGDLVAPAADPRAAGAGPRARRDRGDPGPPDRPGGGATGAPRPAVGGAGSPHHWQTYVDDPRFKANYDKIAECLAEYQRDAMVVYADARLS